MTLTPAPAAPEQSTRRLATIEQVTLVAPIADADAIVRARIRGWDVVVRKDEFTAGDLCVYVEVDTMLDVADPRFAFLAPRGVRTDAAGNKGHVLKTARLRGQYSQGLALPVAAFPELGPVGPDRLGEDVTAALGLRKWDPPLPAELGGVARGMRPGWIPATDEERVQNLAQILTGEADWVATEKIDGTSTTFWVTADDSGVCSRNLDLLDQPGNTLWKLARQLDAHARLRASGLGERVALQGETFGEGIQGNPLKVRGHSFAAFRLLVDGVEVPRGEWPAWVAELSVPVHDLPFPATVDEALAQVETLRSKVSPDRPVEGLVWRAADRTTVTTADGERLPASFKVISNRYLMKNDR
jgi:RNA ligase (TIGR02306 family)